MRRTSDVLQCLSDKITARQTYHQDADTNMSCLPHFQDLVLDLLYSRRYLDTPQLLRVTTILFPAVSTASVWSSSNDYCHRALPRLGEHPMLQSFSNGLGVEGLDFLLLQDRPLSRRGRTGQCFPTSGKVAKQNAEEIWLNQQLGLPKWIEQTQSINQSITNPINPTAVVSHPRPSQLLPVLQLDRPAERPALPRSDGKRSRVEPRLALGTRRSEGFDLVTAIWVGEAKSEAAKASASSLGFYRGGKDMRVREFRR